MKTEGSHGKVDLRKVQALLTGVVAAAMATIFLLAVFALIVWKMEPSAGAENVGVICVSVLSCFAGDFSAERRTIRKVSCGDWLWASCILRCLFCCGLAAARMWERISFPFLPHFYTVPAAGCWAA